MNEERGTRNEEQGNAMDGFSPTGRKKERRNKKSKAAAIIIMRSEKKKKMKSEK